MRSIDTALGTVDISEDKVGTFFQGALSVFGSETSIEHLDELLRIDCAVNLFAAQAYLMRERFRVKTMRDLRSQS
jgi:hypothetical protein